MSRAVIVVPLREGTGRQAVELVRKGPPFDPETVGLERHQVFLTEQEAIFVFEAEARDAAERLVGEGSFWSAVSDWDEIVAGPPRMADDLYSWARPYVLDDVSFEPTPGPGNSDGGDVF